MKRARLVGPAVFVLVLLAGMVYVTLARHDPRPAIEAAWAADGPCTVGLRAHDMNATALGSGARTACKSWLHGADAAVPGGKWQCTYEHDGLYITVRDEGQARYGHAYCIDLQTWSESGGPIPDAGAASIVPGLGSPSPS